MVGSEVCTFSFWWIVPVAMMFLCVFMMRRRRGSMMSGWGCCGGDWRQASNTESAGDILDRRYASGEIDSAEYEEIKRRLMLRLSHRRLETNPTEEIEDE